MARHEEVRADLLAEITGLVPRLEFQVPGEDEPVVVGRKGNGHWSFYFGQDMACHFNIDGQLRRAFLAGVLYRSQGQTLAQLIRERTQTTSSLVRTDLSDSQSAEIVGRLHGHLRNFADAIHAGTTVTLRAVAESDDPAEQQALVLAAAERALQATPPLAPALKR